MKLITKPLTGKRETWLSYAFTAACAINTFSSIISFFLQFVEIVFVHKPQDLPNLTFQPLEQFLHSHNDYLQLLKEKAEFMAGIFLVYETHWSRIE